MPWLPMYADEEDFKSMLAWLNEEQEIAFLVSNGPQMWIAKESIEHLEQERYSLWHIPSGPIPVFTGGSTTKKHNWLLRRILRKPYSRKPATLIENPWEGWKEERPGAEPGTPYFGPGCPSVIRLKARPRGRDAKDSIGLSGFEWTGDYYKCIGIAAHPATHKWWQRLRRRIRRIGVRIPRTGPTDGPNPEIWALPSAYQRILIGHPRDDNP